MKFLLLFGLIFLTSLLPAQITHPKASPYSEITQHVGLTSITIKYSRPGTKGRKVFGNLVPYGRIWRVGANASTKFTVDTDIIIQGKMLPTGTYALYAFPEEDKWEIVFHNNTTHWGDGRTAYNPEEDELRIKVEPDTIPYTQENFLISFDSLDHNSASMQLIWEKTRVSIPISVPTDDLMMGQINKQISGSPTAQTYYEAARYLQEQGKEHQTALNYLEKAISIGGDTYYYYRVKSLVQAKLGDYKAAILSAQRSLDLAKKEGKDEFVRMNEKNIIAWKQLLENK
ncbi:DUF2911 domain-containing protein [Muriicola sp. Z0-33]|uniref:DUF2911 domain-containing protein n=1 Tax=Muriicola sp. Z0-33 TaxID=2816957 RepID=UPI0022370B7C|nr:DUF2911 domain-containing protein [Muriicola sp. Z0-33]MCW5517362.1 DUF2911 domain-containing protein [Muriicola sp. Z0-33]